MARKGKTQLPREIAAATERPTKLRRYKHIILVVCEDEKTEPWYFQGFVQHFPEESIFLRPVGTGRDALGVAERAVVERQRLMEEARKDPDEVWVVFDKDDLDANDTRRKRLDDAFALAEKEGMHVAFSNEVFELWLLLHLQDVLGTAPIPRRDIYSSLERLIQSHHDHSLFVYEHGNPAVLAIVVRIGSETDAIARAKALHLHHQSKQHPIDKNPSTGVYALVERLRELIVYYAYEP